MYKEEKTENLIQRLSVPSPFLALAVGSGEISQAVCSLDNDKPRAGCGDWHLNMRAVQMQD